MKQSLFIILSTFSLLACEKVDINRTQNQEFPVDVCFKIDMIEQIPFENTSTRASLSSLCTRFTVAVFKNDTKVKSVNQTLDEETFGTISMSLQPGTYQLVAMAHNGLGNCTVTSPEKITFYNNKLTDTFYYYGTFDISNDCTHSLSLKRAVSMFRLNIIDELPESVSQMKFYYTGGSSTFNAITGYGCVNSKQTEIFNISETAYGHPSIFEIYSFPHASTDSINVKVTALDADGGIVVENILSDIPIQQNVITQHTGTFFTGVSGSTTIACSFSIEGSGQWSATIDN